MSHFTTLVLSTKDQNLDDLMAPYSEEREMPARWEMDAERPDKHWLFAELSEKGLVDATMSMEDYFAVAQAHARTSYDETWELKPTGYQLTDADGYGLFMIEHGALFRSTTWNSISTWDWWVIGGRWPGMLRLKPGAAPLHEPKHNRVAQMLAQHNDETLPNFEYNQADAAYKRDVDIEGMRTEAARAAGETWDTYQALVAEHGEPDTKWLDLFEYDQKAAEAGRNAYWSHPLTKALQEKNIIGFLSDLPHNTLGRYTREEYAERASLQVLPGYATLDGLHYDEENFTPGTWVAPGKMGMFAMSTDNEDTRMQYWRHVNKLIDEAPDDTILTVIDCHS